MLHFHNSAIILYNYAYIFLFTIEEASQAKASGAVRHRKAVKSWCFKAVLIE